jgi:hypothetical protein
LSQVVPPGLIDEAVAATGAGQRRVRLLPARVVLVFTLAMVVFSGDGYRQVWRSMVSGWPALCGVTPTRSAFTQARRRLGPAPLAWLFARVRGVRGDEHTLGVFAFGLRLVSWDGTMLHVPDSPANAAAFIRTSGGAGRPGGYPQVRLMALIECGTRAVIDAVFGAQSEQELADRLLPSLGPGMLLLADRNFAGYPLWAALRARGAHAVWRLGAHRVFPVRVVLPDGSWLTQFTPAKRDRARGARPVAVRVIRYRVTVERIDRHGRRSTRTETIRLLTSLLDPTQATAADLAHCYRQRWESENSYQELKTWLRGPSVILRSHDPDGLHQELWAHLIVYQALRHLIVDTADEYHLDPDTLPFLTCLRTARTTVINLAITSGQTLTHALTQLADHLLDDEHQRRPGRDNHRASKQPRTPHPTKKPDMTSGNSTYTITITDPKAKENA